MWAVLPVYVRKYGIQPNSSIDISFTLEAAVGTRSYFGDDSEKFATCNVGSLKERHCELEMLIYTAWKIERIWYTS